MSARSAGDLLTDLIADAPGVEVVRSYPGGVCTYWFFAFRVPAAVRDDFAKALTAEGLPASAGYIPKPIYLFDVLREKQTFGTSHFPFGYAPFRPLEGEGEIEYREGPCPITERDIIPCLIRVPLNEFWTEANARTAARAIHVGGTLYEDSPFRDPTLPTVERAARCAAAAGAESIVLSAAAKRAPLTTVPFDAARPHPATPLAHARKSPDELRTQRDNLAHVAKLNHDLGLATHYHNHVAEFDHDFEELRSILEVDPAHLSLCFDIGNAARPLPGAALVSCMERFWDRIGYLHFKDILGDTLAESLGEGEIAFAPIGALARQRGFRGWASAEIEPARGMVAHRSVAEDARLSAAFIRTALGLP